MIRAVIVSLHVAIGGAAGALARSRLLALLLGPPLHVAADRVGHEDIPDLAFETASGLASLALLAIRRGPLDPAVLGGATSAMPDLEHVLPWLRLRRRKLFHRGGHRAGGVSTDLQLLLAGVGLGLLLARPAR
jgi:hypothetical protein